MEWLAPLLSGLAAALSAAGLAVSLRALRAARRAGL